MTPEQIVINDAISFLSRLEYTLLQQTEEIINLKARLERALEG